MSPLPARDRDDRIDALRGFAIAGVLLMNLPMFMRTPLTAGWAEAMVPGWGNLGPALYAWLGQGKFVAILAGLYGVGIARRGAPRVPGKPRTNPGSRGGAPDGVGGESRISGFGRRVSAGEWGETGSEAASTSARRLGFLAALGGAHALIWPGDILVGWALTGALLLATRRVPPWIVVTVGLLLPALFARAGYLDLIAPARRAAIASQARMGPHVVGVAWLYLPMSVPVLVAQATLGAWLGRQRWHGLPSGPLTPGGPRPFSSNIIILLAIVGLVLSAVPPLPLLAPAALPSWSVALSGDLGATCLGATYAALVLRAPVRWFAAVGAAPLSNYLLHSLIFVTVVPPRMGATGTLALATVTFVALRTLTAAWLRWRERGPVEALWRRVTYGTL